MKVGITNMLAVLRVLGTGRVSYVGSIAMRLVNGSHLIADSVRVDGFMITGALNSGAGDFLVPAEELVAIEVSWRSLPRGVTDIPSAIAYEKKAARK